MLYILAPSLRLKGKTLFQEMTMPLRRTFLGTSLAASLLVFGAACGGIGDPTIPGTTHVATITGALTGTPTASTSGAHVALVWRTGASGFAVGADAPIVNGTFTLNLDTPPDSYFASTEDTATTVTAPGQSATPTTGLGEDGGSGSSTGSRSIKPLDNAGGQITSGLTAAVAGFVVYADANGNGQLDLTNGSVASSPDTLLGGDSELMLVNLRGGGSLDYEKLRDKSGVLPVAGFNLAWTEGRWVPLNEVELKLSSAPNLPSAVCYGGSGTDGSGGSSSSPGTSFGGGSGSTETADGGSAVVGSGYPSPSDPTLQCSADGRSFTVTPSCPQPAPTPTGLCTSGSISDVPCAGISGSSLPAGIPVPAGWPCPVTVAQDGGAAPINDASAD